MKGYRFYLEHDSNRSKRKGEHAGNVFAVFIGDNGRPMYIPGEPSVEGIGAVFYARNSDVCGTSASLSYLRTVCKRVSEAKAREIHPKLFSVLDSDG